MRRGFTLIELMIVVAIIGILAAIAIPMYSNMVAKSQEGTTKGNLGTIRSAISVYYGDNDGQVPADDLVSLTSGSRYLEIIPAVALPKTSNSVGHPSVNGVRTGTLPAAITDVAGANGWAYDNSNSFSPSYGQVLVNCTHQDLKAQPWSSY